VAAMELHIVAFGMQAADGALWHAVQAVSTGSSCGSSCPNGLVGFKGRMSAPPWSSLGACSRAAFNRASGSRAMVRRKGEFAWWLGVPLR
jgi:hypothetical protein